MKSYDFPRTTVGGVSLSRMIIGTNWILGYSHKSVAADKMIKETHSKKEAISSVIEAFLDNGVDTIMGLIGTSSALREGMDLAEERTGEKLIRIDTPILNVDNTKTSRREAEKTIKQCKDNGALFCLPHHSSVEQLINKNTKTIDRLPDYLSMIRDNGMIPGLSAHMPEVIVYADLNDYDVETYIQIYNVCGFLMQIELESVHNIIWNAKKPVMTIKSMAAGRITPFAGLNFSWATLRPQDMVTVGCYKALEAIEDIEISMAAFEKRPPRSDGRGSPNKTEIMK